MDELDVGVLSILISFIALAASIYAVWQAKIVGERERFALDLVAHRDVLDEYLAQEQMIDTDDGEIRLRKAKNIALYEYEDDPEAWDKLSAWKPATESYTWQCKVAFNTAQILQNLGTAAFSGMVPLNPLLSTFSETIIDDWLICQSWVGTYRNNQKLNQEIDGVTVSYHRRHAEWLALLSALWMKENWPSYRNSNTVISFYENRGGADTYLRALSNVDREMLPSNVRKAVESLTGIKIEEPYSPSNHLS